MIRVKQRRFIRRNNIFCIFNMHTLHFSSKYPYLILFRLFNELQKKILLKSLMPGLEPWSSVYCATSTTTAATTVSFNVDLSSDIDNCQRLLLRFTVAAVVVVIVTITY